MATLQLPVLIFTKYLPYVKHYGYTKKNMTWYLFLFYIYSESDIFYEDFLNSPTQL